MASASESSAAVAPGAHDSARSTLFTILAELVHADGRPVWTASLLHVLRAAGYTEQAARQAIARGSAAGWMVGERTGRQTRWSVAPALARAFDAGPERVFALSAGDGDWDGRWLVLFISVPQEQRTARKRLYGALQWAGLGNPTPGLWLTPHTDRADEVAAVIDEAGLRASAVSFVGSLAEIGLTEAEIVERAWDLDAVAASYAALLARFGDLDPEPGDPLLLAQLELSGAIRHVPFVDPQLPEALLPGWIGRRAMRRLREVNAAWSPAAHARWREIVDETSPGA
ncbi:MAG TPA: PaaX family transcriptional regulator C-terminal domain-containing protein [Baekduia sp.]|uniref:PaaX family transcriptional regulator n=1 Tax=Baekduia sp. TaxID=2600305 RepID=UPI002D7960D4|nr:PaaX family transcriptional regulator C-terminal domain-containing protein [Baekduia sp.]HET6507884.1 PaaX family transcriptional regulator C-terminal domain-containing protein [Baekduia sp.]